MPHFYPGPLTSRAEHGVAGLYSPRVKRSGEQRWELCAVTLKRADYQASTKGNQADASQQRQSYGLFSSTTLAHGTETLAENLTWPTVPRSLERSLGLSASPVRRFPCGGLVVNAPGKGVLLGPWPGGSPGGVWLMGRFAEGFREGSRRGHLRVDRSSMEMPWRYHLHSVLCTYNVELHYHRLFSLFLNMTPDVRSSPSILHVQLDSPIAPRKRRKSVITAHALQPHQLHKTTHHDTTPK